MVMHLSWQGEERGAWEVFWMADGLGSKEPCVSGEEGDG